MTSALKVTDSNCTIWPMASIKELKNLVGILSLLGYFKVNFLWNKALFLPHKRWCRRNLSVLIEPEVIIISFSLIHESISQILKNILAFFLLFLY